MQPRPESRVESLEKRASAIEAGIIELSNDTAEEFNALRQEMKAGFLEMGKAFDFKTKQVVDAFKAGIIDPVKVSRLCLENAISVAKTFITAETFIVDEEVPQKNNNQYEYEQ